MTTNCFVSKPAKGKAGIGMESRGHRSTAGGEFGNGSTNFRIGGDASVSTCIL